MASDGELTLYMKHVPRVLRKQLLVQLIEQYLSSAAQDKSSFTMQGNLSTNSCRPTIQRFYGALLFVDISGFTALSLRLSVEELKRHINDYFTKMLNIVSAYHGDIVKFAGDAIYIIWRVSRNTEGVLGEATMQTESSMLHSGSYRVTSQKNADSPTFKAATQRLMNMAVACGMEISKQCSNQKVQLSSAVDNGAAPMGGYKIVPTRQMGRMLNLSNILGAPKVYVAANESSEYLNTGNELSTSTPRGKHEPDVAYLNVHSGCSIGLMAGIDIGVGDRFEYVLLGDPLTRVAIAEGDAHTGELVICPAAHRALHGQNDLSTCSCSQTPRGYFCVSSTDGLPAPQASDNSVSNPSALAMENLLSALQQNKARIASHFISHAKNEEMYAQKPLLLLRHAAQFKESKEILQNFMNWARSCLLDDIARHVHVAARESFMFSNSVRVSVLQAFIRGYTHKLVLGQIQQEKRSEDNSDVSLLSFSVSRTNSTQLPRGLSMSKLARQNSMKRLSMTRDTDDVDRDADYSAELRTVIVMFIKIDLKQVDLLIDSGPMSINNLNSFQENCSFLSRSENEVSADELILHKFQSCISIIIDVLHKHGGQLRQFIVDDKGTVAIGSFGLRGAVSVDNSATAIESAKDIVVGLSAIGIVSSIGVTSGKAYCGLVGSPDRHEYAIMGPSTNLSARLMCKAPPCGIICETEIQQHDRIHKFEKLASVNAKGYTDPVQTFRPVFDDGTDAQLSGSQVQEVPAFQLTKTYSADYEAPSDDPLEEPGTLSIKEVRSNFLSLNLDVSGDDSGSFNLRRDGSGAFFSSKLTPNTQARRHSLCVVQSRHPCMRLFQKIVESEFVATTKLMPLLVSQDSGTNLTAATSKVESTSTKDNTGTAEALSSPQRKKLAGNTILLHGRIAEIVATFEFLVCDMVNEQVMNSGTRASFSPETTGDTPQQGKNILSRQLPTETKAKGNPQKRHTRCKEGGEGFIQKVLRTVGEALRTMAGATSSTKKPLVDAPSTPTANQGANSSIHSVSDNQHSAFSPPAPTASSAVDPVAAATMAAAMITTSATTVTATRLTNANSEEVSSDPPSMVNTRGSISGDSSMVSSSGKLSSVYAARKRRSSMISRTERFTFSIEKPVKLLIVTGPSGSGKGTFLAAFNQKLFCCAKKDPLLNISLLKNSRSHFRLNVHFYAWKSLIVEILMKISRFSRKRRSMHAPCEQDLHFALKLVFSQLPKGMEELKPLLGRISVLSNMEDTAATERLNQEEALERTADLLAAIVGAFPKISGNLVFITLEGLHLFDPFSLKLLYKICDECKGLSILASYEFQDVTTSDQLGLSPKPHGASHSAKYADGSADHWNAANYLYQSSAPDIFAILMGGGSTYRPASSTQQGLWSSTKLHKRKSGPGSASLANNIKKLPLASLSRDATRGLIEDVLQSAGQHCSSTVVDKIYHASHGHPLYSYELARMTVETSLNHSPESVEQILESELRSHRIEEVICHRFDQLDSDCQMLLKVVSVICANGAPFSIAMLEFMFVEGQSSALFDSGDVIAGMETNLQPILEDDINDDANSEQNSESGAQMFTEALLKILQRDEFLQLFTSESDSLGLLAKSLSQEEDNTLTNKLFHFRIVLEQMTIYNLLLDDQKHEIHELTASFFDSEERIKNLRETCPYPLTPEDTLVEEAYHWSQGLVWSCALVCYFQAASLVSDGQIQQGSMACHVDKASSSQPLLATDDGDVRATSSHKGTHNMSHLSHLLSAYMMFTLMKRDASTAAAVKNGNRWLSSKQLEDLFGHKSAPKVPSSDSGGSMPGEPGPGVAAVNRPSIGAISNESKSFRAGASTPFDGIWTTASIEVVFGGDTGVLFMCVIQTIALLGTQGLRNFDDPSVAALALEEALQLHLWLDERGGKHSAISEPSARTSTNVGVVPHSLDSHPTRGQVPLSSQSTSSSAPQQVVGGSESSMVNSMPSPMPSFTSHATTADPSAPNTKGSKSVSMRNDKECLCENIVVSKVANNGAAGVTHKDIPAVHTPVHQSQHARLVLLATLLEAYTLRFILSTDDVSKMLMVAKELSDLAVLYGSTVHILHATAKKSLTLFSLGEIDEALSLVYQLARKYDPRVHSASMLALYGVDSVPQALSHAVFFLLAQGRIHTALRLLDIVKKVPFYNSHRYTFTTMIFPLCRALVFAGKCEEAKDLFSSYTSQRTDTCDDPLFNKVYWLYYEWLQRVCRFDSCMKLGAATGIICDAAAGDGSDSSGGESDNLVVDPITRRRQLASALAEDLPLLDELLLTTSPPPAGASRLPPNSSTSTTLRSGNNSTIDLDASGVVSNAIEPNTVTQPAAGALGPNEKNGATDMRSFLAMSGCSVETIYAHMCIMKAHLLHCYNSSNRGDGDDDGNGNGNGEVKQEMYTTTDFSMERTSTNIAIMAATVGSPTAESATTTRASTGASALSFLEAALSLTEKGAAEATQRGLGGSTLSLVVRHLRVAKGIQLADALWVLQLRAQALTEYALHSATDTVSKGRDQGTISTAHAHQECRRLLSAVTFLASGYRLRLIQLSVAQQEMQAMAAATAFLANDDSRKTTGSTFDKDLLQNFRDVRAEADKAGEWEQSRKDQVEGYQGVQHDSDAVLRAVVPLLFAAVTGTASAARTSTGNEEP